MKNFLQIEGKNFYTNLLWWWRVLCIISQGQDTSRFSDLSYFRLCAVSRQFTLAAATQQTQRCIRFFHKALHFLFISSKPLVPSITTAVLSRKHSLTRQFVPIRSAFYRLRCTMKIQIFYRLLR